MLAGVVADEVLAEVDAELDAEVDAEVDTSLLGEALFIIRKGDIVDMLSTKTGVGGFLKEESSSSSELPSSSEQAVL